MIKAITIGCRLNQTESSYLVQYFSQKNSQECIVINTCGVTETAARKSLKIIRRYLKNKSAGTKLIITGCLVGVLSNEKMVPFEESDVLVLPHKNKVFLTESFRSNGFPGLDLNAKTRPAVKIADGCPNECSYCLAQKVRGKLSSVPEEIILKEVSYLKEKGAKEIVLTALNLGAYGLERHTSLYDLLKKIPTDSFRLRLSSLEPDTITDELLSLWQESNIVNHLHIPIQSMDDEVLRLMGRNYLSRDLLVLFEKIIKRLPDANIGADIIVGFPNETEKRFLNTYELLLKLPISYLHIFPYSPRPQTKAYGLGDPISKEVKKERLRILKELDLIKRAQYRKRFINTYRPVIIENNGMGITDNYLRVRVINYGRYKVGEEYKILLTDEVLL